MDVYFATSMRKAWEYADLYDFVNDLMNATELSDLPIQYFDPTQSYTDNRIDKGLVESLMLKRAQCTVYSVQDTDTLGKDSELAATLAQGKPVIAYVPCLEESKRVDELTKEFPATILDRLRFVLNGDEGLTSDLPTGNMDFVGQFSESLRRFVQTMIFRSVVDQDAVTTFREEHRDDLQKLCRIIA